LAKKNPNLHVINEDLTTKRILLIYLSFLSFKLLILFVIENMMIINDIIKFVNFDYNLKDMKPEQIKVAILLLFMPEKYKVIESFNSDFSYVVHTLKNLKYLKFPENINANNLNTLYIIVKKCKKILKILHK